MTTSPDTHEHEQIGTLRARLADAEEMLRAIREGDIDALVVEGAGGSQVYTLHSAEEPYRTLVEQMREGALVLTRSGDILYSNARFAELVGEPLQSVVGSRIDRFVNPSGRDDFEALLVAGNGRRRSTLIGARPDGIEVCLSLTTTVSTSGDRLNLVVTDLSELLEANSNRDRAERDNRTKDEFLAMLAHELRTPLGAIGSAVSVLESTHDQGQTATFACGVIGRQVTHVSHLIEDLLDVERLNAGKIRLNRQALDMAKMVHQAIDTFIADSRLDRQIDVSTEPVWVDGDAVRLEQVLTNIVANAVKYTPPGGLIRVTLRSDGGDAVLSVEDSGFGISPSLLPSIFDLHVQGDQTIHRARGGLGIGLAIVRRLVELHGGTVAASSDGEGHGSRFTVRVRKVPSAEVFVPPERRAKLKRVLLIEDSGEARERLRIMLELTGSLVYDTADGARGIELLNVVCPDVGIINVNLPGVDGYQVARRIREEPLGRGILLLALTDHCSPGDLNQSSEHGFDYHLVKPVDPDYLARLISEGVEF